MPSSTRPKARFGQVWRFQKHLMMAIGPTVDDKGEPRFKAILLDAPADVMDWYGIVNDGPLGEWEIVSDG